MHFSCARARSYTITTNNRATPQSKQTPPVPAGREDHEDGYGACAAVGVKAALISTTSPLAPFRPAVGVWLQPRGAAICVGHV